MWKPFNPAGLIAAVEKLIPKGQWQIKDEWKLDDCA
jgi:hypothetical protein